MVQLPKGARAVDEFYEWTDVWSPESLNRLHVVEEAAGIKIT